MDMGDTVPTTAQLRTPSWLWGKNPSEFFSQAGLHRSRVDAGDTWRVQTEERYLCTRPSLITLRHLAGPAAPRPRFETLRGLAENETLVPEANDLVVAKEIDRLAQRAEMTRNPVDAIAWSRMVTIVARPGELSDVVRFVHDGLLDIGLAEDPSEKVFAHCGVHVLERNPAVLYRLRMASVWLRLTVDENLALEDPAQARARLNAGDAAFESSRGLYDGIYTMDAYIGPLLGALSPAIWSFHCSRPLGTILYTLGQPLAGTTGTASELLQILPHQSAYEPSEIPSLSTGASSAAAYWWADKLNQLFAILSDPAVFTNHDKHYVPAKHLHALLTVEQLFRRVTSIQMSHRDANARRTLLFTVLDTLERLTGRDLTLLCSLARARKTLDALTDALPCDAAEILLPAARRAVDALEGLQEGFFISRQAGSAHIEWTDPRTGHVCLTPDDAAAEYVKVLRNSTHGHGSNREGQVTRTNALLTHHNGHVPHDLALIGYLYLLDLLNRPDALRKSLYQNGRV
jgi:hypothetical protein